MPADKKINYFEIMLKITALPIFAIVATGRTGSDLLHSLLDSHPQVLTINGHFLPYSQFFPKSKTFNVREVNASDIADELIGHYIFKLISRYDTQEGMDRLGKNLDQFLDISTSEFKYHFVNLLKGLHIDSKNCLLAFYGAYNLCIGKNINETKILLHHPHLDFELELVHHDFLNLNVIFTVRDPRANICSLINSFKNYYKVNDNQQHFYTSLKLIFDDTIICSRLGIKFISFRLEDSMNMISMRLLAEWMGINFEDSMLRSTWGGLDWHGDKLSQKTLSPFGWSSTRTYNNWKSILTAKDKFLLNTLTADILKKYCYDHKKISFGQKLICFFLIPLPFSFELRYFSFHYLYTNLTSKNRLLVLEVLVSPIFYIKRIKLCYTKLLRTGPYRTVNGTFIR